MGLGELGIQCLFLQWELVGMGGDSKLGENKEGSVACEILGGFSLDSGQPCQKIWLFPCLVGLEPLNPLDLLHRDGKLRHMGAALLLPFIFYLP